MKAQAKYAVVWIAIALSLSLSGCGRGTLDPTLTSIAPASVTVGDPAFTLFVSGTSFTSATVVNFGGALLTPSFLSPTSLTVTVPATAFPTAKAIQVSVTGSSSNSLEFTILNPLPTLTSLSAASVTTGSSDFTLEITGTNFVADTTVDFGGTTFIPSAVAPGKMTVVVSASAIAKGRLLSIRANNRGPGGGSSNGLDFTVTNPMPALASLSLSSVITGGPDFVLDISGSNFVSDTTLRFGSLTLTPVACTPTRMSVNIPAAAISRAAIISLTASSPTPGGGVSNGLSFTIANPLPSLSWVSPPSVTAGANDLTLTVTGTGFSPDSAAVLGETPLNATFASSTQLIVSVPAQALAQAGSSQLTVSNPLPGGGDSNQLDFTVHARAVLSWATVVNNNNLLPNSANNFNSYNQPSINSSGLVVFKGQGKGNSGNSGPSRGIYTRRMSGGGNTPITLIADDTLAVPAPNNTTYNGGAATFTEFPSFPRIDSGSDTVVFRGQHQPVYTYTLPDGTESRIGSAGIYSNAGGSLLTGVGLMGIVPDYSYFQVPGAAPGTRFDQFPGSPAVTNGSLVAFKGNYTEGDVSKTGVFYRDLIGIGGKSPVELIANTSTVIPNQPAGGTVTFGATAPPSAVNGAMVFTGWDNEDNPTLAGIYLAPLQPSPPLQTLVGLESQVPGEAAGTTFKQLGEGLTFDGRYVGFWASWGPDTKTVLLVCPADGNKDIIAACNQMYPSGYQASVPIHQGIFVYDTATSQLTAIAKAPAEFDDFLYWVFSGRPPGTGGAGEDVEPEPPRWRFSAFLSVSGQVGSQFEVAFKANSGTIDGIYLAQGPAAVPLQTILDTATPGQSIDPLAPSTAILATVGLEREAFRGDWFVLTTSMLDPLTSEGLAGIYVTHMPAPGPTP